MKGIIRRILYVLGLEGVGRILIQKSALKDDGWFTSVKKKQAVNNENEPIPWLTYPFIDFISDRLNKNQNLFEFGAGNSSLFYSGKVGNVTSIEHSKKWYDLIKANNSFNKSNLEIKLVELPEDLKDIEYHQLAFMDNVNNYVNSLDGGKYDIIVVDGLFRNSCMIKAVDYLTDEGVIFLDNTHTKYQAQLKNGTDYLKDQGFKRLDFWGMGPIYAAKSCTSVFYKENNCLGI